jgi:hypothetical protein
MNKRHDLEKQEVIVGILWAFLGDNQNSDHDAKQCRDDGMTITANVQALNKALTGILEIFRLREVEVQLIYLSAMGEKLRKSLTAIICDEERIAKMLKYGGRVRLWHDQRFLDWDSNEWVVMDSLGNKGLGCSLYVGSDLDKALDALEGEGK